MIKKCLGYLLVFIGIVILIFPILKDVYIKHEQKKIISNYTYAFENTSYLFEDNTEQPIITLITCHPQSGTHRLIVRGKIID